MLGLLQKNWWLFVLRGLFAIIFGILAIVWPGITLVTLVFLFGFFVLFDGILLIGAAVTSVNDHSRWWLMLLEGLFGVGFGLATFIWPGITALILLILIASWAIITGILEIAAAIRLRKEMEGEWMLALSGILSIALGGILITNPGVGAIALIWVIGSYAILFGILLIALGMSVRSIERPSMA